MELRELRAFVAVAEHGGVARAASALYLSPSSISQTIRSLEIELGVQLFHRLPRGMVLTDVGQSVLGAARRALQEIAVVEAAAATTDGLVVGRVTMVPGRLYLSPVVRFVAGFRAEHPLIVVSLLEPENEHVIADLVRHGHAEIGVMSSDSVPPDLLHLPIGTQTTALVVPADHPLAGRRTVELADLEGVGLIAPSAVSPFRPMYDRLFRAADVEPHIVAESDHLQTMLELVLGGVGATVAPFESAAHIVGDAAAVIPFEPRRSRSMSLIARSREPLAPPAEALWQFVARGVAADTADAYS
jgi:LysR family carnitine catabolism transcriptional activator